MNSLKQILKPLASIKLAIVLMVLAILLIYAGTIAQIDTDNWFVQKRFFQKLVVVIGPGDLIPHRYGTNWGFLDNLRLPIPGGYGLGLLLLINLIAAHVIYFKLSWKRLGIILIHFSLIMLLVGEGVRASMTHEAVIQMARWQSANYTSNRRDFELAVIDPSPADHDIITVIPETMLVKGKTINDHKLPFSFTVDDYFRNSELQVPAGHGQSMQAGQALEFTPVERPPFRRQDEPMDQPSARLTLSVDGQTIGQLVVSTWLQPKAIPINGKTYVVDLRPVRTYRPYSLYLLNLSHDTYAASNQVRNFSSKVRLFDPQRKEDRQALIWMNHPLRYRGDTFYQFQMPNENSVLQVVDNPGWLLPYFACGIGGLGMLIHFGIALVGFTRKRREQLQEQAPPLRRGLGGSYILEPHSSFTASAVLAPVLVFACGIGFLAWVGRPRGVDTDGFNSADFASFPLLFDGRQQPMQTLARNSLRMLSSQESLTVDGQRITAIRWLLDMFSRKPAADDYQVFRIDSPDVIHLLDLDPSRKYFSMREISRKHSELLREARKAADETVVKRADRDAFQRSVLTLYGKIDLYRSLWESSSLSLVAPLRSGEKWQTLISSEPTLLSASPAADAYQSMVRAYANRQADPFNKSLRDYDALLSEKAQAILQSLRVPTTEPTTAPTTQRAGFDFRAFGRLPMSLGEVQSLEEFARRGLFRLSGGDSIVVHGQRHSAIEWLLDVFSDNAQDVPVFQIHSANLRSQLGLDPHRQLFAPAELETAFETLSQQMATARQKPQDQRTTDDTELIELEHKLMLYDMLAQWRTKLSLSPPLEENEQWHPIMRAQFPAAPETISRMLEAYSAGRSADFNHYVGDYRNMLDGSASLEPLMQKIRVEMLMNRYDPFWWGIWAYVIAFVLACMSWLFWARPLGRTALSLLVFTLIVHSLGLAARVYVQGRPPVTNLYSSAIFIGFGAIVFALILERIFRNGIGSVCAAAIGFVTLLIAHYLAMDERDTMAPLEAVLDTNIWLATHVVCITLGYASTFLAGFLAIVYVVRGVFSESLTASLGKDLVRMIYGIAAFAIIFSFVGTILGGIWADQSWGRFWGWDSKENGAAILVLWNALILHARWRKLVFDRGFVILAIAGNIVTAWSWFGTNMLGIGLHSYGFMDKALSWLLAFACSQLALIAIANLPLKHWRSPMHGPLETPANQA